MTINNIEDEYGTTHLFEHLPGYTVDNGHAQMVFDDDDDILSWYHHLFRAKAALSGYGLGAGYLRGCPCISTICFHLDNNIKKTVMGGVRMQKNSQGFIPVWDENGYTYVKEEDGKIFIGDGKLTKMVCFGYDDLLDWYHHLSRVKKWVEEQKEKAVGTKAFEVPINDDVTTVTQGGR